MKKNVQFSVLILVLLLTSFLADAQTGTVSGVVRDVRTGQLLPGATAATGPNSGVATDADGKYSINAPAGELKIEFRCMGYTAQSRTVSVIEGQTVVLDVALQSESTILNTVVVSAGKFEQKLEEVTVSMAVLKPAIIENTNATSVDVVMEQVPGVNIIDGQANIRGGSGFSYGAGSRVLLLVDDLPMLAADAGDVKWSFLPVENIDQIEVIKGASSALFGSAAMNGVINVRSAYPKDKPETKINWFSGWYGNTKRVQLQWWGDHVQRFNGTSFSHMQKAGKLDIVAGGNFYSDAGYRQGEDEERYRLNMNTRYRFARIKGLTAGVNANVTFSRGGNYLIWQNDSTGAYLPSGGLDPATTTISIYQTQRTSVDPFVTYSGENGVSHKLRMRYFSSDNRNNTNQQSLASSYFSEYQFQKRINEKYSLTGGMSQVQSVVKSELYEDHNSSNISVFAQADVKFGRFNLSAGGRYEMNSIDQEDPESIPVFRSGINFKAAEYTFLRASYGQGYRYPSIAERYISTQVGSIVIYPNDSVQSETGQTAEFGIKQGFKIGKWTGYIDVAAFWSRYKDMIEFTFGRYGGPADPLFGLGFKSVNIGNTQITGFEIEAGGTGKVGRLPVNTFCGFTYIEPEQLDYDSSEAKKVNTANYNVLKYRYRRNFKADVEVLPGKYIFGLSVRYNSFMENIDLFFEQTIPGIGHYRSIHNYGDWVFDLRAGYNINEKFRMMFIVRNLFNHEYMGRPADMQPPRNYTLQLSYKF